MIVRGSNVLCVEGYGILPPYMTLINPDNYFSPDCLLPNVYYIILYLNVHLNEYHVECCFGLQKIVTKQIV